MSRLVILDGLSWIRKAVHSPAKRASELIFLDMLQALLGRERPDYFLAALDGPRHKLKRREIDPGYKGTRPDTPDHVRVGLDNCTDLLKATGAATLLSPGWEADDVIATVARLCAGPSCQVVIATMDKDLGQCVTHRVQLWDGSKHIGPIEVRQRWGVAPELVPHVQALAGDTSDNVPGCPGIGLKYAIQYIQRFGSVKNVYDNRDRLTPKKREAMDNFDWQKSLDIVTMRTDLDIPLSIKDLEWEGINQPAVGQLLSSLGL